MRCELLRKLEEEFSSGGSTCVLVQKKQDLFNELPNVMDNGNIVSDICSASY